MPDPNRKSKLKLRAAKSANAEAKKLASLDRLLKALGIKEVFDRFPAAFKQKVVDRMQPGTEIVVAEDSREDPEIKETAREIRELIKKPTRVIVKGRDVELALDDFYRAYYRVTGLIASYLKWSRLNPRSEAQNNWVVFEEAQDILDAIDENWVSELLGLLMVRIADLVDRNFRVDGRMIDMQTSYARKPEGGEYQRMELKLHTAAPHVASFRGLQWKTFRCLCSHAPYGLLPVAWDCQQLGICGPSGRLPVYITEHAVNRLHERLPMKGYESWLHQFMVSALEEPVITPQDDEKCLVELRMGSHRVGYFVAHVLPHLVLVKTFLFLTMHGTPESALLREKLGLCRADIEKYYLDDFFTLAASDVARDPLLVRVLSECGCGHLISMIDNSGRLQWLDVMGEHFKRTFELREARDGFVANRKWTKWSD